MDTVLFNPDKAARHPEVLAGVARPIFLNVGRVAPEKNIEAFLALDLPGTKVVVGDGPAREALQVPHPGAVVVGARSGAAYPAPGPSYIIPGAGAGGVDDDLRQACLDCLKLDRGTVRRYAEGFSWRQSAEEFVLNLQPYPEPEKTRFWRRLRRLARLRRRAARKPAA